MFVNVLDYSACTVPVLEADKSIDVVEEGFQPFNEQDQAVHDDCEPALFPATRVSKRLTLPPTPAFLPLLAPMIIGAPMGVEGWVA